MIGRACANTVAGVSTRRAARRKIADDAGSNAIERLEKIRNLARTGASLTDAVLEADKKVMQEDVLSFERKRHSPTDARASTTSPRS